MLTKVGLGKVAQVSGDVQTARGIVTAHALREKLASERGNGNGNMIGQWDIVLRADSNDRP